MMSDQLVSVNRTTDKISNPFKRKNGIHAFSEAQIKYKNYFCKNISSVPYYKSLKYPKQIHRHIRRLLCGQI